jgi:serine phosphatase RsbU (regulator of sigma subunit)
VLNEINVRLAPKPMPRVRRMRRADGTRRPPIFLGLFYATFDITTRELRYANADLPPPMLTAPTAETLNERGGPAIGMLPGCSTPRRHHFDGGETCCLYTDGLNEARNLGRLNSLRAHRRVARSTAHNARRRENKSQPT